MQKSIEIGAHSLSLDRSEDGDFMCINYRVPKSLFPKLRAVLVQIKKIEPFKCNISVEDIDQEDILNLFMDEDDGFIDENS